MQRSDDEMVYAATLKTRFGLTTKLIRELGEPDKLVPNPNYKSGPPARLFLVKRVKAFVTRHRREIKALAAQRENRQAKARKGVETKTNRLLAELDATELRLTRPLPSYEELQAIASSHATDRYGEFAREPGLKGLVSTVRHEFTNYEQVLRSMQRRVGGATAYESLRARLDEMILRLIDCTYPGKWINPEVEAAKDREA